MSKLEKIVVSAGHEALSLDKAAQRLLSDLRGMIESARQQVSQAVNAGLTMLCWGVGRRIREDILKAKRAEYGERIVSTLGRQLPLEYGAGFSEKSLRHMIRIAEAFLDGKIVSTLT